MKRTYNPATARTYYLNQSGHRAISIDGNGNRETIPVSLDGVTSKPRSVLYWESCGNFGIPVVRVRGKAVAVHPDTEVPPVSFYAPFEVKYPKA